MRKSRAIRAAMVLRKWCKNHNCNDCVFHRDYGEGLYCQLLDIPSEWVAMSFDDEVNKDATD